MEMQTSRLIVKNLPIGTNEEILRKLFKEFGEITDLCLKYTKSGVFRKFGFVGFRDEVSAKNALNSTNKSFINTSKIQVEYATDLGDKNKPRAWSKYSQDSSAYKERQKLNEAEVDDDQKKADSKNEKPHLDKELFGELYDDPEFRDFLTVSQNESQGRAWGNDTSHVQPTVTRDDDDTPEREEGEPVRGLSDSDYLKTKVKGIDFSSSDDSDDEGPLNDNKKKGGLSEKQPHVEDEDSAAAFVVKMRGFRGKIDETSIREFFSPIHVEQLKIPRTAKCTSLGIAYVYFKSEADCNQALGRSKNFIGTRRIYVAKCTPPHATKADCTVEDKPRAWDIKNEKPEETVAESGRLFIRNLAYICAEDDLEQLCKPFGPLSEVHLPLDKISKKTKGFAYVTYMMPEHATCAFSQLDGSVFQGRMLHVMAAHEKREIMTEFAEGSSFKNKKAAGQKKMAGSSHNWNTLFLGANAVADAMVEKYGTSKSLILDVESNQSLGVRMALGETQIVAETRAFLIENGVCLDSFSQAAGERSKTVILVKNLPASTSQVELQTLFTKYGTVARIVMPPSGITAIVEFTEPTEARAAFRNLAYTKFHHVPLYLEWAPLGVFNEPGKTVESVQREAEHEPADVSEEAKTDDKDDQLKDDNDTKIDDDDDDDVDEGAVLSVKNLNFSTTEEQIKKLFERCGKVVNVTIAKKKDIKNPGRLLSMGYGFVQYKRVSSMNDALKTLQHASLEEHVLELRISNRSTMRTPSTTKRKQGEKKQLSTKILVRNIPFEAKQKEVAELFQVFGQLKYVRIPKKVGGAHRGFGFVDFVTKQDAKRAFKALCHSTHLYGRRLVLEWADEDEDLDKLRKKTAENFQTDVPVKKLRKSDLVNELNSRQHVYFGNHEYS